MPHELLTPTPMHSPESYSGSDRRQSIPARRTGDQLAFSAETPGLETPEQHSEYRILNSPELRIKYLHLTDELINKMVREQTEVAVFLDKSARPVGWLMHALWDQLAPHDAEGNTPPEPQIKFLNIDREQWGAITGRTEDGMLNVNGIPQERIDELRHVFAPTDKHIDEASAPNEHSMFAGKRVMLVDEVSVSGDTLRMSKKIFERAFPDATAIDGQYWMSGNVKDTGRGVRINTDLPVWYSDKLSTGRGVADRDTTKSSRSNSARQRIGRYWLSTTFREGRDKSGTQLREEAAYIAADLRDHKIIYKPSGGWIKYSAEGMERRMMRLNGITMQQYVELRHVSGNSDAILQDRYVALQQEKAKSLR